MSRINTGRKHSAETVKKIVVGLTGRPVSEETRAKIRAQAGWKHTQESREKMSLASKGTKRIPRTEEHRRKISVHKAQYWEKRRLNMAIQNCASSG
jgi:hypothetical protein